jgi:hypothetical protein
VVLRWCCCVKKRKFIVRERAAARLKVFDILCRSLFGDGWLLVLGFYIILNIHTFIQLEIKKKHFFSRQNGREIDIAERERASKKIARDTFSWHMVVERP